MKKRAQADRESLGGRIRRWVSWAFFLGVGVVLLVFAVGLKDAFDNPGGRVIQVFPVDATHVAMLRERTWSFSGSDEGESGLSTNHFSWTLVVVDPTVGKVLASTRLFEASFLTEPGRSSVMRAGRETLFLDAPTGLMRLNLRTGAVDDEATLRALTPTIKDWQVGGWDEDGGFLLIHDVEMRWWLLHADLRTEPTQNEKRAVETRRTVDQELVGCISGRKASFSVKGAAAASSSALVSSWNRSQRATCWTPSSCSIGRDSVQSTRSWAASC